jgi:hypothetical protein
MERLPKEMSRIFIKGGAYSSWLSRKENVRKIVAYFASLWLIHQPTRFSIAVTVKYSTIIGDFKHFFNI